MMMIMMMVKIMVSIMMIRAQYYQMGCLLPPSHPVCATAPEKVDLINCMNIMIIVMMMMMVVKMMVNIMMTILMMLMI